MATFLNGVNGKVTVGTHQVLRIEKWTGTLKIGSVVDLQEFGSSGGLDRGAVGQPSMDGSFNGRFDPVDTAGQVALKTACYGASSVSLSLYASASTLFAFTAYIESIAYDTPSNGVVGATYNYKSSGDITITYA